MLPTVVPGQPGSFVTRCFNCPTQVPVTEDPPDRLPMCDRCRMAFTTRRLPKPFVVRVAATVVRWPGFCACCCMRANSLQRLGHSQTTEEETTIRKDKHVWDIPYCLPCIEHSKLYRAGTSTLTEAAKQLQLASRKLETTATKEVKFSLKPMLIGLFWGLFVTIIGPTLFNPLLLGVMFPRAESSSLVTGWFSIIILFGLVGVLLGLFLWYLGRQKMFREAERKLERAEQRTVYAQSEYQRAKAMAKDAEKRTQGFLHPGCSNADLAVHYVGWQGDTHVFYFDNETYAVAFVAMNKGYVVEPMVL